MSQQNEQKCECCTHLKDFHIGMGDGGCLHAECLAVGNDGCEKFISPATVPAVEGEPKRPQVHLWAERPFEYGKLAEAYMDHLESQQARLAALLGCPNEPVAMQNAVAKISGDLERLREGLASLLLIEQADGGWLAYHGACGLVATDVARDAAICKMAGLLRKHYDFKHRFAGGTDVQS